MNFTVIIPCHNEESVISDKISNTLLLGKSVKELIVIDDHSTDNTLSISRHLAKKYGKIKVLQNSLSNGKNFAMRSALRYTSGDVVCMTDADVFLPVDAISHVLPYFQNSTVGMVCLSTQLVFSATNNRINAYSFIYERVVRYVKIFESIVDSVPTPHGQALFFRKKLNLDPQRQADDVDLAIQTRKKGYKVKYLRDCFFQEKVVEDINKLHSQKIRRCKAVIDSLLYHNDVMLNLKYGLFGFICYPLDLIIYVFSPLILFVGLSAIFFVLLIFSKLIAFLFFLFVVLLFTFTKFRTILNLILVNLSALKEYFLEGSKNSWKTARESNQKN